MDQAKTDLQGVRGWLIVVGLIVVIGPLYMLAVMPKMLKDFFYGEPWAAINAPGSVVHWGWKPLVLLEVSFGIAAFIGSIVLFCQFFGKQRGFPRLFIATQILSILFYFGYTIALHLMLPGRPLLDTDSIVALLQTVVPPLIWIPYMLKSERIKQTFVE
ncbi:DUF2569 domain-containing protein [Massilia genomosp. 1]|uniref:DUF2569 family protein n=1 Tax=Massilia genomosp. 1 TaxID=2609280 RepID=A0ABX0N0A8_9BURK|nr:DUF2569 family protein [Massilia genomosp. 1]